MAKTEKNSSLWKNPLAIILTVILLILVVSWAIPTGAYERELNEAGQMIVVPGSYQPEEKMYIPIWKLPSYLVDGINSVSSMLVMMLLGGGAMQVIIDTGAIQWFVQWLLKKTGNRSEIVIVSLTTMMGLLSLSASITGYIALTPVFVQVAIAMGYDAMLGAAMLIVGTGVGFSCGALRTATTAIAQTIAELPIFSGLGYRMVVFVVLMMGSLVVLIRYAHSVRDTTANCEQVTVTEADCNINVLRRILVLLSFIGSMAVMAVGCIKYSWGMNQLSALFVVEALLGAVSSGTGIDISCKRFLKGFKEAAPVCLITGIAAASGIVLQDAGVLDTIVYWVEMVINNTSGLLVAPMMFIVNFLVNVFIGSGSGQAMVVMPVMVPISDMLGVNRQIAVLAFNLGDGLCNYLMPTASVLVGPLALAKLSYTEWIKKMKWVIVVWVVLALILMIIAQLISYS